MNKLIGISEMSKILNLIDPITKRPLNHILRYWEKEFKQIKPKKITKKITQYLVFMLFSLFQFMKKKYNPRSILVKGLVLFLFAIISIMIRRYT